MQLFLAEWHLWSASKLLLTGKILLAFKQAIDRLLGAAIEACTRRCEVHIDRAAAIRINTENHDRL